jgi:lincosamide nucleotidyltransferase B/F
VNGVSSAVHLLERLELIARQLEASGHASMLIGLGSVGRELERIDAYSDLDFFVVVQPGFKAHYLEDLSWLTGIARVAFLFRNTVDGYKLLYEDGIFCEFAVFEPAELTRIPFAAGRIVWKHPDASDALATPVHDTTPHEPFSLEWQLGEALTNLLIGLKRFARGEKLSGSRFVQQFALDRVVQLNETLTSAQSVSADPFGRERRLELRYPDLAARLPDFVQGYERTPESALAILEFLEAHFEVNPVIAREIRALATR